MPTITKSIGTSSRDYSTITAWEADLDNAAIYAAGDHAVGECYKDSAFDEDLIINGGATRGLASVLLTVASSQRHDGTAGTGARIVLSTSNSKRIEIAPNTVSTAVAWLELNANGNRFKSDLGIALAGTGSHDLLTTRSVRNMLIHGPSGSMGSSNALIQHIYDSPIRIANSILYNATQTFGSGDVRAIRLAGTGSAAQQISVQNCTIHRIRIDHALNSSSAIGIDRGSQPVTVQNCLVTTVTTTGSGAATCYGSLSGTLSHNVSSDATASGTGSLTNKTAANQYVSTVVGSEDLHLKAGSDCINAGTDLGTTPTGVNIDINGRDRDAEGDTWDIGAHEYVASGTTIEGVGSAVGAATVSGVGSAFFSASASAAGSATAAAVGAALAAAVGSAAGVATAAGVGALASLLRATSFPELAGPSARFRPLSGPTTRRDELGGPSTRFRPLEGQ